MLMAGLKLSWQRRRWSSDARGDALFVLLLTQLNLGKGYFSYDGFTDGPSFYGDACRGPDYTGGGYVTSDGFYDWWQYGARAAELTPERCPAAGSLRGRKDQPMSQGASGAYHADRHRRP